MPSEEIPEKLYLVQLKVSQGLDPGDDDSLGFHGLQGLPLLCIWFPESAGVFFIYLFHIISNHNVCDDHDHHHHSCYYLHLFQVSSAGEQDRNEDGAQGPLQPVQLQKVAASPMVTAMFLPVTVLLASGNIFSRVCCLK